MPVSVSIADTLDPEPEYICSKSPEELINRFYQSLVRRSAAIREDVTQNTCHEGLSKDQRNLINQWCKKVPVIGFNSGRYDLHLIRKYFVSHLGQENGVFAGEKQGQIMYINTPFQVSGHHKLFVTRHQLRQMGQDVWREADQVVASI